MISEVIWGTFLDHLGIILDHFGIVFEIWWPQGADENPTKKWFKKHLFLSIKVVATPHFVSTK